MYLKFCLQISHSYRYFYQLLYRVMVYVKSDCGWVLRKEGKRERKNGLDVVTGAPTWSLVLPPLRFDASLPLLFSSDSFRSSCVYIL